MQFQSLFQSGWMKYEENTLKTQIEVQNSSRKMTSCGTKEGSI